MKDTNIPTKCGDCKYFRRVDEFCYCYIDPDDTSTLREGAADHPLCADAQRKYGVGVEVVRPERKDPWAEFEKSVSGGEWPADEGA